MKKINITRISVMLSVILLSICIYVSQTTRTNTNRNIGDAVQVTALPVSGKTVILDAGHGTPDEGGSLLHQVKNRSNYFFIKNNCRCKSLQFF